MQMLVALPEIIERHQEVIIVRPVRILVILLVAVIVRVLVARMIRRITRAAASEVPLVLRPLKERIPVDGLLEGAGLVSERRRQRAETIGSVLGSVASITILVIGGMLILSELKYSLAPVLASAGILGVAVGFGAQNLVKDFLSGIFMLLEDQYGVGDVIDVGSAKGTVESVTLRITKLRDVNGVAWYVRNGEISRLGNESQNWARVILDVPVAHDQDVKRVEEILKEVADALAADPLWDEKILEEPSVWGVQELTNSSVVVRITLKTAPGEQGPVARDLRARVKAAFDDAGVAMAAVGEK